MNIQIDSKGKIRHFLSIDGINRGHLLELMATAQGFLTADGDIIHAPTVLAGKTIANLFFEPSTRTRCSFEIAAKNLGAQVINFTSATSSLKKGESLSDTVQTLVAMGVDALVIRHQESRAPEKIARNLLRDIPVINAGDGIHAHPSQALLDMLTISRHKANFRDLSVAIIGDISHSRVARSDVQALMTLEVSDIRLVGPHKLIPNDLAQLGLPIYTQLEKGVRDVDVIICLRIQHERMQDELDMSATDYYQQFGLTKRSLGFAKPNAIVMHPMPMNRGVEIESAVADGDRSVIFEQVRNGIVARMAILQTLLA